MIIRENISKLLKEAMKKKDIKLTSTLRLILAAIKDKDIIARSNNNSKGVNETEIVSLLQNMIKQRNASIKMYIQGKRDDLVKIEEDEIKIISNFLPEQLSQNEIDDVIIKTIHSSGANSIKDMGKVINLIRNEYNGKMDFGVVSKIIKEKLLNL